MRQILTAATFCYLKYFQSLHNGVSVNMFHQKRKRMISLVNLHLLTENNRVILVKKAQARSWKNFFSNFQISHNQFLYLKTQPMRFGNCCVPNFCKTGFRYFCSLFTSTLDKFVSYTTGLLMPTKLKLPTKEG